MPMGGHGDVHRLGNNPDARVHRTRGALVIFATRNKCIASSNKCLTSSNKKLLETLSY